MHEKLSYEKGSTPIQFIPSIIFLIQFRTFLYFQVLKWELKPKHPLLRPSKQESKILDDIEPAAKSAPPVNNENQDSFIFFVKSMLNPYSNILFVLD